MRQARQALMWFWKRGILSTFLAGLFALLPIVITLGIMAWAGGVLKEWLGPESFVGQALSQLGLRFVTDPTVASVLSWVAVLLSIWLLGVLLKSVGKKRIEKAFHTAIERLMLVNVILVVFNMLPAFPMDGGRVLRALLATKLEYTQATHIAANIGQAMALVFGFLGFIFNPFLLFIALFVWIGAAQEASVAQRKSSFAGIPVTRAMTTDFQTLTPHDPLARATERILAGSQQDFPVLDDRQVVGIPTRHDLFVGLTQRGQDTLVGESMQREFETVDASEMLEASFRRLQSCQCHTAPVLQRGELVGLVTMENVGEFVAIQAATKDYAAAGNGDREPKHMV